MIYLPVETSGEGEINAHRRVQMALGEAKNKAKKEFAEALEQHRPDAGRVPRVGGSASGNRSGRMYQVPHTKGVVGPAANFVLHIAEQMKQKPKPRARKRLAVRWTDGIHGQTFLIGMDVGSTTVKAVVIDAATDEILWRDYQRHDTKQPEKVLEFCKRFETEIDGFQRRTLAHVHHRLGRQRPDEVPGREVRAGSERRFARGGEAVSRNAAR